MNEDHAPLCACGCSGHVEHSKKGAKPRLWNLYLSGHNTRIDNPLRDHPENRLYGKDHPMFGRTGDKAPMWGRKGELSPRGFLGKHHTIETIDKYMETKAGMDYWWMWGNKNAKKKIVSTDSEKIVP